MIDRGQKLRRLDLGMVGLVAALLATAYWGCSKGTDIPNGYLVGVGDGGTDADVDDSMQADSGAEGSQDDGGPGEDAGFADGGDAADAVTEPAFDAAACLGVSHDGDFVLDNGTDLSPLTGIECLNGNFEIHSNSLDTLDGLETLTHIRGNLVLFNANSLQNVDGLANLAFVGGDMQIQNEGSLGNLAGLAKLTYLGGTNLTIKNNGGFSQCWATWVRDRLVANGWSGTEDISGNNGSSACPP